MKILRIPTQYHQQIKFCSTEDCEYILKTIFELSNNPEKKVENSMRGGLVSSIWREAVQMENKARAKKGEKRLNGEVATLTGDIRCDSVSSVNSKKLRPSQVKSNQINKRNIGYSESFLEFWENYPKKESKGNAYKSWCNLSLEEQTHAKENIKYLKKDIQQKEKQYQKLPATWLNQKCFEDSSEFRKTPEDWTIEEFTDLWNKSTKWQNWYKDIWQSCSWNKDFVEKYPSWNRLSHSSYREDGNWNYKLCGIRQRLENSNF